MARVGFEELFRRFYGALESVPVAYFAYGGVAVGVWGDPRETQDVDAVVVIGEQETSVVLDALARAGFECPANHRRLFPVDGWARLEFRGRYGDLALGRTAFDESAFARRRRATIYGLPIWVASAEDLVLYKLVAYRYKDLADAEAVLTRQKSALDLPYLRHWAGEIAAHTGKFEVPARLEEMLGKLSE